MMHLSRNRRRSRSGRAFTIIEIVVVVVIIGILAAVIAPRIFGRVGQAKQSVAASNAAAIANAVRLYMTDNEGRLPQGVPLEQMLMGGATKYMDNADQLIDPWGNPFVLIVPGRKNADFDVVSYGADKREGGEGDDKDIVKP